MQRHGGIQFIPSDKPDPYLGGREYGHLFDDPSDEVIVKFGEVQAYPKSEEKAITKTNNLSAKVVATNVTSNNGYVDGLIRHP